MICKVFKINYKAKNIVYYIYNYLKKFETFATMILWFELDKIRGGKILVGCGAAYF